MRKTSCISFDHLLYSRHILLLLALPCLLLFANNCLAQVQQSVLKGRLLSKEGSEAQASIELRGLKRITKTDHNGYFQFNNLPEFADTLVLTSAESPSQWILVKIEANRIYDLGNIYLDFTIGQLADVEVRGRLGASYKSDYSFLGTKTQTSLLDIPQSISVITKELLRDKMELTLKSAAHDIAGVNDYSGYDEYTIRGFRAENARMINGLRGYNTGYNTAMLVNIERIEVVKGPSATLYGNCDPGGTINMVTKKPLSKNAGEITIAGGTWGHSRAQGDVTGPLNDAKTVLYRFNAGFDNTGSFRDQYTGKSFQIAPSFSFIPGEKIQLNADFSYSRIHTLLDRGQPGIQTDRTLRQTPISLIASQPGDYLHEDGFSANILLSLKINNHIHFNAGYLNYITQQDVNEHGVHSYISPDSVNLYYSDWDYHTITNTLTNNFTFHFKMGRFSHQLLAGYDHISSKVRLDQQYFENRSVFGEGTGIAGTFSLRVPQYTAAVKSNYSVSSYQSDASLVDATIYRTQGVSLQDQIIAAKWRLLIGLREEFYKASDDDADSSETETTAIFLPRLGLVYSLSPGVSLYGTYNRGFDPFEASISTQVFNETFRPITSELMEMGCKANFFHNKLTASLAVFRLVVHHVAVNANDISNPNLYVQQGEARSTGLETEWNGNVLPNFSISASYSYCVAKFIQSTTPAQEGALLENAPRNQSNSWLKYIFQNGALKGLGITAGHNAAGLRNTLEPGLTLPGYCIMNAGIRYEIPHFSAGLNFNNIFNKTYWMAGYNNINKWPGNPFNCMVSATFSF